MSDLVERLRLTPLTNANTGRADAIVFEAADEIEVLRAALVTARHEMRRSIQNIMAIETEAMGGDNLAVSLCSYFERHDEDVCEDGWTPAATEAYDEIRGAIESRFAPSERIFEQALSKGTDNGEG